MKMEAFITAQEYPRCETNVFGDYFSLACIKVRKDRKESSRIWLLISESSKVPAKIISEEEAKEAMLNIFFIA